MIYWFKILLMKKLLAWISSEHSILMENVFGLIVDLDDNEEIVHTKCI